MTSTFWRFISRATPAACWSTMASLRFRTRGRAEPGVLAMQALLLGMLEVLPDLGGVEQRLGGHAADMKAGAAELGILFDERGLEAVLAGADGSGVAPGTAANHDHVVGHRLSLTFANPAIIEWEGNAVRGRARR